MRQATCGAKLPPKGTIVHAQRGQGADTQATLDLVHGAGVYRAVEYCGDCGHDGCQGTHAEHHPEATDSDIATVAGDAHTQ